MEEREKTSPQRIRKVQEEIWKRTPKKKYELCHKNFEINVNPDF